ncbi:MAG: serine/threonine-protein kinase, partial [Gemmatimonadaceae bacterium]
MSDTHPAVDPLFLSFQLAVAGRYSIDRELGRGGMGIVYLAREVHLDRLVAIKLLPPERAADDTLRERFLREARLAAKLSHPNIIPIHAVDEVADFVFFVMAFVDGETLAQRVRTRGPLASSEGARVLREVSWALAYAHAQGLVHRDVKPDNILLEATSGRVLVADFGIAAAAGDTVVEGVVTGTPEFMSPEQALGKPIDARSDLYALGATAFYSFSGRLPFEGKTPTEVLAKHVTETPPPLSTLGLTVPRKLALLVDRCLAKEPEHRPASAQALAEQLGVALEQRREMPAALRDFVKRSRLNGSGTLLAGVALLPISSAVAYQFGGPVGFTTFVLGLTVAPFGYLLWSARRVARVGFTHGDLAPAFRAEIEQAREELSAHVRRQPSGLERWVRRGAKGFAALSVVAFAASAFGGLVYLPRNPFFYQLWNFAQMTVPLAFGAAIASTAGLIALMQRHRDVDTEFWS